MFYSKMKMYKEKYTNKNLLSRKLMSHNKNVKISKQDVIKILELYPNSPARLHLTYILQFNNTKNIKLHHFKNFI